MHHPIKPSHHSFPTGTKLGPKTRFETHFGGGSIPVAPPSQPTLPTPTANEATDRCSTSSKDPSPVDAHLHEPTNLHRVRGRLMVPQCPELAEELRHMRSDPRPRSEASTPRGLRCLPQAKAVGRVGRLQTHGPRLRSLSRRHRHQLLLADRITHTADEPTMLWRVLAYPPDRGARPWNSRPPMKQWMPDRKTIANPRPQDLAVLTPGAKHSQSARSEHGREQVLEQLMHRPVPQVTLAPTHPTDLPTPVPSRFPVTETKVHPACHCAQPPRPFVRPREQLSVPKQIAPENQASHSTAVRNPSSRLPKSRK